MNKECDQSQSFEEESFRYYSRNYQGKDLAQIPLNDYLQKVVARQPFAVDIGSILDIGCCPGSNLYHLKKALNAKRCVGLEPSSDVVRIMQNAFLDIEFHSSNARILPFGCNEFDLVIMRSVLHWVDRNYLLQTLGEAMRVTRHYLLISDYSPIHAYSAVYRHRIGYKTFKMSYQDLIEATLFMRCIESSHDHFDDQWNAVQTALYKKIDLEEAFPIRRETDFR